jgi:sodium-dependent dicarboxylate transporter 2/3/5
VAFLLAVTGWVGPGIVTAALGTGHPLSIQLGGLFPEGVVAVIAASLLFVLPTSWPERRFTLTWREAEAIDWGTLLLFGGGLSLGGAMFSTGLAAALGKGLTGATGAHSLVALTVLFSVFAIYFTEVTSNTATATMLVPLAIAAAQAAGVDPVPPALGCALGCSMAFMLPVATPPNAIVYGSGQVPITRMVRAGFWLNIAACVVIPAVVLLLAGLVR